jgi:hypothetical protein
MQLIVGTKSSHPPTKRKGDRFIILLMLRSGARSIIQLRTIWKSA